ncbi:MAG: glycosyl hydrolase family 18 protein [Elusimicrobiota bacterium]
MRARTLIACLSALACLFFTSMARARAAGATRGASAWVVPWDSADAAAAGCFDELNPFAFALSSAQALVLLSPDQIKEVSRLRRAGVLLVPVVVNDVYTEGKPAELKSDRALNLLLSDSGTRDRHVAELAAAAQEFDGLEIDYEQIPEDQWVHYAEFIVSLAASLHKNGKKLYIDVEPKLLRNKEWANLSHAADRIKVMAYYELGGWSARPGPGNSTAWVAETGRQALRVVPREKLVVALSLAGTDWAPSVPEAGSSSWTAKRLNYGQVMDLRAKSRAEVQRDASGSPSFRVVRDGGEHEIWFEDEKSLEQKVRALHALGISRIAVWYWGRKHPDAAALGLCRP